MVMKDGYLIDRFATMSEAGKFQVSRFPFGLSKLYFSNPKLGRNVETLDREVFLSLRQNQDREGLPDTGESSKEDERLERALHPPSLD